MTVQSASGSSAGGAVSPLHHLVHGGAALHLSVETPERVPGWDCVILTAASEAQAAIYEEQLAAVRRRGLFPARTKAIVVQDPEGKRIGSGGATLNALRRLAEVSGASASDQRVLLVHAGGDSKRVPWASVFGKCFIPFPALADADRPVPTIFDHILAISASVTARMKGGGLLCFSGDALPLFASSRLDLPDDGAVVVTSPVSLDVAGRHGVIVAGADRRVTDLLQKPDIAELTSRKALVRGSAALLDTGIYAFCGAAYRALVAFSASDPNPVQVLLDSGNECSLYEEIAAAFVPSRRDWLRGQPLGIEIDNALGGTPLFHHEADGLTFVHMGTTGEVLTHLRSSWAGRLARRILAECGQNADPSSVVCASATMPESTIGRGSMVYGCRLGNGVHVGTRCVVLNVDAEVGNLFLPDNVCLWQVPVVDARGTTLLTVCCGVDDNPKLKYGVATFANRALNVWLEEHGLAADDLWRDDAGQTLWTAKLFPVGVDEPLAMAMWMLSRSGLGDMAATWRGATRMSFADLHAVVDAAALTQRQKTLTSDLVERSIQSVVHGCLDRDLTSLGAQLSEDAPRQAMSNLGGRLIPGVDDHTVVRQRSRLLQMRADLCGIGGQAVKSGRLADEAFEAVQGEVAAAVQSCLLSPVSGLSAGREERAELPVRFDFAGGWSDTPPYCLERPAAVLNMAAILNGEKPVGAHVVAMDEPRWELVLGESDGEMLVVREGEILEGAMGLKDRFALLRQALVLTGFGRGTHITQGVRVRTWAHVPRGSGLGTSSILGAALLTALQRLVGRDDGGDAVSDLVLLLEQRLTTGGGWQDQLGGLIPGIKLVSSVPVQPIRLTVEPVPLLPSVVEELESRLVIAFTGIERLAKNVLQIVVGRYLQRDGRVLTAIADLVDLAHEGRKCFAAGDIDGVAHVMGQAWDVHQILDPHCGNVAVDAIFERIADLTVGVKLAGAGGGGFLGAMAKDAEAAKRARRILSRMGHGLAVYDWRLFQG